MSVALVMRFVVIVWSAIDQDAAHRSLVRQSFYFFKEVVFLKGDKVPARIVQAVLRHRHIIAIYEIETPICRKLLRKRFARPRVVHIAAFPFVLQTLVQGMGFDDNWMHVPNL